MHLCQSTFRALRRCFAAGLLLSGVIAALWGVAAIAVARLIDLHVADATSANSLPLAAVLAIAVSGAAALHLARGTLLHRRQVWLEHDLAEQVLAHELWTAAGERKRNRTLAAVTTTARFVGSQAAVALIEMPWALLAIGCLWYVDTALAAVATASSAILLGLAAVSSRRAKAAQNFDFDVHALRAGQDSIRTAAIAHDASLNDAQAAAAQWEVTQRGRIARLYKDAQSRARRSVMACSLVMLAAGGMVVLSLDTPLVGHLTPGALIVACAVAVHAQRILAQFYVDGPMVGAARAARTHLMTLRGTRPRERRMRRIAATGPDLRAPIAASILATAASMVGLALVQAYWQVPLMTATPDRPALRRHADAAVPGLARAGKIGSASGRLAAQVNRDRATTTLSTMNAASRPNQTATDASEDLS